MLLHTWVILGPYRNFFYFISTCLGKAIIDFPALIYVCDKGL